jgi:NADPH:quinone reductase-like Zn-dependent oxidoreductase
MVKAVRYDEFGGIDVLRVEEVERPVPGDGQVLVRVKAAGINPSEAVIRTGAVAQLFPSTFPSGQGSDLAGVIEKVGAGARGFSPGRRGDRIHEQAGLPGRAGPGRGLRPHGSTPSSISRPPRGTG